MFYSDYEKVISGGNIIYLFKRKEEQDEFLTIYHDEGYKLAAGYLGKQKRYYVTLLKVMELV